MKNYKDYPKVYLGMSDIASLTLTGGSALGDVSVPLYLGGDGDYYGRICDTDIEIPSHYKRHIVLLTTLKFTMMWK